MPPKKRARTNRTVWFTTIDDQKNVRLPPTSIQMKGTQDMDDLKRLVKDTLSLSLLHPTFGIYRCRAKLYAGSDVREIAKSLKDMEFGHSRKCKAVSIAPGVRVDELRLDDLEVLVVQVPIPAMTQRVELLRDEIFQSEPSLLGVEEEFQKITGSKHIICCNRPFEYQKIPLVLLDEVFALFKDRCKERPTVAALECLEELAPVACRSYKNNLERRDEMADAISEKLGLRLYASELHASEAGTDGHVWAHGMAAVIRQCREEPEEDVLNQAILYYARSLFCAFTDHNLHDSDSRFPCILMIDMGSYMGFHGAAWDGVNVRVEPLATFDLAVNRWEKTSLYAIASALDALVAAVKHLKNHYKQLAKTAPKLPIFKLERDCAREFPFLTSYTAGRKRCNFTYKQRVSEDQLIFVAAPTNENENDIIVKFVMEYSEEAHRILHKHNFAPKLLGSVKISSRWKAIIMEKSPYTPLGEMLGYWEEREKIRTSVAKAIKILHDAGYVHGDVRDTNILVDPDSLETLQEAKIHIIDFDWAGKDGEVYYPLRVNTETIGRPEEVEGGGKICTSHDLDMIEHYLFQ